MARCTPTHLPIHPYIHPSIYMSQYPYTTLLFPQPSSKIHCKSLLTGLQILHNQSQTHLLLVHVHTARQTDRQPSLRLPCFASCNATPECKKKNKKTKKYTVCQMSPPQGQARAVFYGGPPPFFSIGHLVDGAGQAGYLSTYQQEVVGGGGVCGLVRWLCAGDGGDGFPLHGGVWADICVAQVEFEID
jgi:hypothetical protein